jgi:uncharacterized coiled-coil protein SlyX
MAANSSIQQHEPLRVPSNWGTNEKRLIAQLEELFDDIYRRFGRLRLEDLGTTLKERLLSTEGIVLEVGAQRVFRAATESDLLIQLAAESPVVPMAVSLLWYDTTNKLFKRCTALGPPIVWETLQTNEVHTSYIDLAGNKLDIGSTGEINIAAGGNINIKSGANLKIEAGGDLNIASGGALNVTAPTTLNITAGSGASAVGIKNDTYFLFAGNATPASAPFSVTMLGAVTAISGTIGGFTLASNKMEATPSGKPVLTLDAANSEIGLGAATIFYDAYGIKIDAGPYTGESYSYFEVTGNQNGDPGPLGYIMFWATVSDAWFSGDVWVSNNCSALSFTDRTPSYTGDALAELALVKNDKKGNIDHSTLPALARKKIKRQARDAKGKVETVEEDGRDLGMMVSIQTKAIQQLREITTAQQQQIDKLTKSVQQLNDLVAAQQKQIDALPKGSKK